MAPLNWNPNTPIALGLEWPGMRTLALPLSQEVEYGYTIWAAATETIDTATFEIVAPMVNIDSEATALVTVYQRDTNDPDEAGNELEYGTVHSTMCPVNGGTVTAPAALQNAATLAEAVATPSDYKYVLVTGGSVDMQFATAGLFTGKRILEVKVHYSATAVSDPQPRAVMSLDASGSFMLIDDVPINEPGTDASRPTRVVSLGEVKYPTASLPKCWPWTVADVQLFDSTTTVKFLTGSPLVAYGLEYVALEVVWCEENRVAVGALLMGSNTGLGEEPMTPGRHTVDLRTPTGSDNWAKVLDNFYTVTLCSARSPGIDVTTRGVAPLIPAVDGFTVFEEHQGRVAPRLASNVLASADADSRITPIRFTTTAPATSGEGAPYDRALGAYVFLGNDAAQDIAQWSGGGTVSYPWIRFYARIIGDPVDVSAIDIKHSGGTIATYTAASLLALPEIYDGWREVTLQWPAGQEPGIANSGAAKNFWFTTTQGNIQNRWEILALDSEGLMTGGNGAPTYGGGSMLALWYDMPSGNVVRSFGDLAVTIHTAAPAVSGFVAVPDSDVVAVPDWCAADAPCMPGLFWQAALSWSATSLTDATFAYWEIQRQDTFEAATTAFETVARLTTRTQLAWLDRECRVGVTSTYRMRVVRVDGIAGAWTATDDVIIPTSAAASPAGALIFTTNADPTIAPIVYREVFESAPADTFGFAEAEWVQVQHFFGRFGQQAFRPTERGGVTFERTVLVNALATPTKTAEHAFLALRDLAWADVPYVCVKDDLGNRWYASVIVPEGNVRRSKQIYLASVQVIEATQTPYPATA